MDKRLAKYNFDFCQETAKLKQKAEITLIDLGGRLHKIFNQRLYEPNYDSFKDYVEDLKLSPATASKLIAIHQRLILNLKISKKYLAEVGGWSSVSEVVNLIENKKQAGEWLEKVRLLNRTDLRREITEAKTGILMSKCLHENTQEIVLTLCKVCGLKVREYDDG